MSEPNEDVSQDRFEKTISKIRKQMSDRSDKEKKVFIDHVLSSIKYLFMLNGAAAIATTSMFSDIYLEEPDISVKIFPAVIMFCMGSFTIVASYFLISLGHYCKNKWWDNLRKHLLYLEPLIKNKELPKPGKLLQIYKKAKIEVWNILEKILKLVTVIAILLSLFYSIKGFLLAINAFQPQSEQSVNFTKLLYPSLEITAPPITKPN